MPRPLDLDDEDYRAFMKAVRKVCDGKSLDDSIIYLRKLGRFLECQETLIDEHDVCTSIWNPLPKQLFKHLLNAQQSYVAYKIKTYNQVRINDDQTVMQTVFSLIVNEQVKILQTSPSAIIKPVFQRSDSSTDDTNKKTKWW